MNNLSWLKNKGTLMAAAGVGLAAICAACAAPIPPGILPPNDVAPASQGPPPALSKYLVPYAAVEASNDAWTKQSLPSLPIKAPKGCDRTATDFAQFSDMPEEYELLIGCPTPGDINVFYSQVNWAKMRADGWKPVPGYGSYGSASRAFVQFYNPPYSASCWTYLDVFKAKKIFGVTGYCDDLLDASLPAITKAAEAWTAAVLHQIDHVQNPSKPVVI